ncbi:MAG: AAA family ATPase [Sulfolobales archaeon]|nr:AAA family ATPase [Sulfolobales archaeon]
MILQGKGVYGEWLEVRNEFKEVLSNSPDKVLEMIKNGRFVPCLSVGNLEDWINPLKYSIYGEVGYTVWSFNAVRSFDVSESGKSFSDTWLRMLVNMANSLRISIFYVSGIGIVGLGFVTDYDIDIMREFKRMTEGIEEENQTSRSGLSRVRMKVIWLHKNVRTALQNALNRDNDLMTELQRQEKWQSYECGNIPNEIALDPGFMCGNLSASVVNEEVNQALKQLIKCIVEKDEQGVRDTYNFYNSLTNLKAQSTPKVETPINVETTEQLKPIECGKGSIKDVEALSNKFFVYTQRKEDFFKLLASSAMIYNVLLVGPPGTGKTSMAIGIVEALTGKNSECYEIATANALWFRRNLVGGESLRKGEVSWSSGILIRAYNKAARVTNGNYYVIIDEINRADVDKAFGEILTLMSDVANTSAGKKILDEIEKEIRKFGDENSDKLDEDAKQFLRNLKLLGEKRDEPLRRIRFIATMNEVDANNLFPIGEALTRRFLVFRIPYPCGTDDVKMFMESEEFKEMKKKEIVTKVVSEEVNELRKKFGCDELKEMKSKEKMNFNISPASVKLALSLLKQIVEDNDDERSIRKKFLDALESSLGTTDERILKKFIEYKTQRLGNSQQPAPS